MNQKDETQALLIKVDQYINKNEWCQHHSIFNKIWLQIKETYETILNSNQSLFINAILMRTLFEQLISLIFIIWDDDFKEDRYYLFKFSARLRLEMRIQRLYSYKTVNQESDTLSQSVHQYHLPTLKYQLDKDIEHYQKQFDQIAIKYMTQKNIENDIRRRRWYRMRMNVCNINQNIETLRDVTHYLLGELGNQLYYLFYSIPSILTHGHWLFDINQFNQWYEKSNYYHCFNELIQLLFYKLQGQSYEINVVEIPLSPFKSMGNQDSVDLKLKNQFHHLIDSAQYFLNQGKQKEAIILLRPALEILYQYLSYTSTSSQLIRIKIQLSMKELYQIIEHFNVDDDYHYLSILKQRLDIEKKAILKTREGYQFYYTHRETHLIYNDELLNEVVKGLFSVIVHGIDWGEPIKIENKVLIGTLNHMENLLREVIEDLKINYKIIEQNI